MAIKPVKDSILENQLEEDLKTSAGMSAAATLSFREEYLERMRSEIQGDSSPISPDDDF